MKNSVYVYLRYSSDSSNYHTEFYLIRELMDSLITVEMFEDTEKLAIYFEDKITRQQDEYLFRYYKVTATERAGEFTEP